MRRFLKFWFPVILYSGIIFYVSSFPSLSIPLGSRNTDKIIHIFEYLPFGWLFTRAIISSGKDLSKGSILFIVFVLSFLYGLSDEFHQSFVPGRDSSLIDTAADAAGGLLGSFIYLRFITKSKIN